MRSDITRGNEALCSPDARVSQVLDVVKHGFTESVRDRGAEVARGNVSMKGSTKDVMAGQTEKEEERSC